MLPIRSSGVLLHITSLPSPYGIGDLGPEAYRFAEFLERAGQLYWQILPLSPTSPGSGESPYSSDSAFAGNPLLISPDLLEQDGYLHPGEAQAYKSEPSDTADFELARGCREDLLERAFRRFLHEECSPHGYAEFCSSQAHWLEDYALFRALKAAHGWDVPWTEWPGELKYRDSGCLSACLRDMATAVEREKFRQFLFFSQWQRLRGFCRHKGMHIFGDLPIYVSLDSADVWSRPELFKLDHERKPHVVAGVPPDYFSETGQLWGNPVYDWQRLRETGFAWWLARLERNLELFDMVRIDHFRGLVGYWEVPADAETAQDGWWQAAPGTEFLRAVYRRFPEARIVAEDLGEITADVRETMAHFGLPGMKPIIFGFTSEDPGSTLLPHNIEPLSVAYTGTHDTNTVRGWFEEETSAENRQWLADYLGREVHEESVAAEMIRLGMMSPALLMITPMQDVLGLASHARMNTPATTTGNWSWRVLPDQLSAEAADWLRSVTRTYGRI